MEIVVSSARPATPPWVRPVLVLAVCLPVTLLVLLPACFGLHRYVVTGDDTLPGVSRGTLLIERSVPLSDVRVDDVVTFREPTAAGPRTVTRRVVAVDGGRIRTAGERASATDQGTLGTRQPIVHRVALAVPWVGYLYLVAISLGPLVRAGVVVVAGLVLVLAVVLGRRDRTTRPHLTTDQSPQE